MNPLSGAVMGSDPLRSQAPRRSDGWDKDDDDRRPQNSHAPDEEVCPPCEDTTVGGGYDGCRVPRCRLHDRGQGGFGLAATGEAHEAHAEA